MLNFLAIIFMPLFLNGAVVPCKAGVCIKKETVTHLLKADATSLNELTGDDDDDQIKYFPDFEVVTSFSKAKDHTVRTHSLMKRKFVYGQVLLHFICVLRL